MTAEARLRVGTAIASQLAPCPGQRRLSCSRPTRCCHWASCGRAGTLRPIQSSSRGGGAVLALPTASLNLVAGKSDSHHDQHTCNRERSRRRARRRRVPRQSAATTRRTLRKCALCARRLLLAGTAPAGGGGTADRHVHTARVDSVAEHSALKTAHPRQGRGSGAGSWPAPDAQPDCEKVSPRRLGG